MLPPVRSSSLWTVAWSLMLACVAANFVLDIDCGKQDDDPGFDIPNSKIPGSRKKFGNGQTPIIGVESDEFQRFRTYRRTLPGYDHFTYELSGLPNGPATLTLEFVEYSQTICSAGAGGRVFSVEVDGTEVLADFDVFVAGGQVCRTAVVEEFPVVISGGEMDVKFIRGVGDAMISGMRVVSDGIVELTTAPPTSTSTSPEISSTTVAPPTTTVAPATTTSAPTTTTAAPTTTTAAPETTTVAPTTTMAPTATTVAPTTTTVAPTTTTVAPQLPQGWSTVQTNGLPKRRHEATFVMGDGGKAYLLGGRRVQPVGVFDTATSSWTDVSPPPEELHHFQAVYAEGLVWIPAAWTGGYPFEANVDSFHVYNPAADSWSKRTPLPADRRRGSSAVTYHNGKLYVAMGNRGGHGAHATTLGWLDVYDIASDTWSTGPDAPNPRDHTGGAVVNGRFCVAGGRDGGQANFFNMNTAATNCYNFATGAWEAAPDMPTPRAGSSYGRTCDGKLMVAGGEGNGQAYSRVDVFNGASWEAPTFLAQARHGSGVAVAADCSCANAYVASGSGGQGGSPELTSTEVYAPYGTKC